MSSIDNLEELPDVTQLYRGSDVESEYGDIEKCSIISDVRNCYSYVSGSARQFEKFRTMVKNSTDFTRVTSKENKKSDKFVKVMNADMTDRFGLSTYKYKEGLNVYPGELDVCDTTMPDMVIYRLSHLYNGVGLMGVRLIADVEIPEDAKVVDFLTHSTASKFILSNIREFDPYEYYGNNAACLMYMNKYLLVCKDLKEVDTVAARVLEYMYSLQSNKRYIKTFNGPIPEGQSDEFYAHLHKYKPCLEYIKDRNEHICRILCLAGSVSIKEIPEIYRTEQNCWSLYARLPKFNSAASEEFMNNIDQSMELLVYRIVMNDCRYLQWVRNPSQHLIDSVFSSRPENIKHIPEQYRTREMCEIAWKCNVPRKYLTNIPDYIVEKFVKYDESALEIRQLNEKYFQQIKFVIDNIPGLNLLFKYKSNFVFGSFVRWTFTEMLKTGNVPSIDRVFKFLETTDIDISCSMNRNSVIAFNKLHKLGAIIEYTNTSYFDEDLVHKNNVVSTSMFKYSSDAWGDNDVMLLHGNYHIWVPHTNGKYIKFDVSCNVSDVNFTDDYTVNILKVNCERLHNLSDNTRGMLILNHLTNARLCPIDHKNKWLHPKQLYRAKKLLLAGFKPTEKDRATFKKMVNTIHDPSISTAKLTINKMQPSVAYDPSKMVHLVEPEVIDITRNLFEEDENLFEEDETLRELIEWMSH